ncbi:hypothetical protein BOVATA_000450 [Babesia ovata]|uniref:Uncharacterized protein n=1 Tax=Babesia ovata TaxID=189622 RepID=A0A2H6K6E2_9APIC|nr:uncharacterized protein BOVATA_000450 [Babesia ovata]GBE58552.1 hypothetical protein BOVATA_000450 [Babesia ovata]
MPFIILKLSTVFNVNTTLRIIPPNVRINLLFKLLLEAIFNGSERVVELRHDTTLLKLYFISLANYVSRLLNRRLGRSLDLCFGGFVEIANGGGKVLNCGGELSCDFIIKLVVAEQDGLNFVSHLAGGGGKTEKRGFSDEFNFFVLATVNPL